MSLGSKIIRLRNQNKTYFEICGILECSKAVVSYHCKKAGIGGKTPTDRVKVQEMDLFYKKHTRKETAKFFNVNEYTVKYYCKKDVGRLSSEQRRLNGIVAVNKRRVEVKAKAVEYKGGKCQNCGYSKYIGALEFHHIDPKSKRFSLSSNGFTRKWSDVILEIDKCILLCANCHREEHQKIRLLNKPT